MNMNINTEATETTKQLINSAKQLVSGDLSEKKQSALYESILKSVRFLIRSRGMSFKNFTKIRNAKKKKNGGFRKGYILSEKVLPITKGVLQDKIIRDDQIETASGAQKEIAKTSPEGIKLIPEKLVRDNIPSIIETQAKKNWEVICEKIATTKQISLSEAKKRPHPLKNYRAKIRIAAGQELLGFLKKKILEKAISCQLSVEDKSFFLEDLTDILELVDACHIHQLDPQ